MSNKKVFSILKYVLALTLVLFTVIALSLVFYHSHMQRTSLAETEITTSAGIDLLEKVELGGIEQWILVRSQNRANPVLLFLHGGPGSVMMPHHRVFHRDLEDHFTVVHWDQRGAGKSFDSNIPPASMSLTQVVADTLELSELLTKRFNVPKIFIVGHSWGTKVGTVAVSRRPELFYAYVGIGQVVDDRKGELISYEFALRQANKTGNKKASRALEEIGLPPYSPDEVNTKWGWLLEFGGVVHSPEFSMFSFMAKGLSSPDYSLYDWMKYGRGVLFSPKHITTKTDFEVKFMVNVPKIEIPVYFFAGRYDYITPSEVAEQFYNGLIAPAGKHLVWFENSGHLSLYEEPDKFMDVLINTVLAENLQRKP
jgi:pimeloyl-ACP methyl ester carboxylesterase